MSTPTSPRPLLSGESDPTIQSQREKERNQRVSVMAPSIPTEHRPASTMAQKSFPLIQLMDEHNDDDAFNESYKSDSDEPPPLAATSTDASQPKVEGLTSLMEQMMAEASNASQEQQNNAHTKKKEKVSVSGLKKGFLLSSGTKKKNDRKKMFKNENTNDGVVHVTASNKHHGVLPEVQNAMRDHPLANGEWATSDLMESISSRPCLMEALKNPRFTMALHTLQSDPSKAKRIFQEYPDIADLLQQFCGILGTHFTKLDTEQQKQQGRRKSAITKKVEGCVLTKCEQGHSINSSSGENDKHTLEQERVDKVLADRELAGILMDPEMQRVMGECSMPGRMLAYMHHPEVGPKLKRLMDAGLLQVAR